MIRRRTCVLCGEKFEGYGHNARPLKDGECCDECNYRKVVPERLKLAKQQMRKEK